MFKLLDNSLLLPERWRSLPTQGPHLSRWYVFNPSILKMKNDRSDSSPSRHLSCASYRWHPNHPSHPNQWILAYRVVGPDRQRRIALCQLDGSFQVLENSHVPLSDLIHFRDRGMYPAVATQWFADPRLFRLANRLYIYWNSGWHDPWNHQFIQELDQTTLCPLGHPRELVLPSGRQKVEKNWTFFGDGPFYAVYGIAPHVILQFSMEGSGDIAFTPVVCTAWDDIIYTSSFGMLRGGAIPQLHSGQYTSICHSVYGTPGNYRYVAAAYSFDANFPFRPCAVPHQPLSLNNPLSLSPREERLNPAIEDVIYPCGAILEDQYWIISYGINDQNCAIMQIPENEVLKTLRPLAPL